MYVNVKSKVGLFGHVVVWVNNVATVESFYFQTSAIDFSLA